MFEKSLQCLPYIVRWWCLRSTWLHLWLCVLVVRAVHRRRLLVACVAPWAAGALAPAALTTALGPVVAPACKRKVKL
jgi:hypothetical protein